MTLRAKFHEEQECAFHRAHFYPLFFVFARVTSRLARMTAQKCAHLQSAHSYSSVGRAGTDGNKNAGVVFAKGRLTQQQQQKSFTRKKIGCAAEEEREIPRSERTLLRRRSTEAAARDRTRSEIFTPLINSRGRMESRISMCDVHTRGPRRRLARVATRHGNRHIVLLRTRTHSED
jgi:hypothetical protein